MANILKHPGCIILGHKWIHIHTKVEDKPIPNMRAMYTEKFSNIWQCEYCGISVKAPLKKQPDNSKRAALEAFSEFLNRTIE